MMELVVYSNSLKCPKCNTKVNVQAVPKMDSIKNKEEFLKMMEWCYENTEFSIVVGKRIKIYR